MTLLTQRRHAVALILVWWACWGLAALAAQPSPTPEPTPARSEKPSGPVVVFAEVDGIIHPVSAEFMIATIDRADLQGAALVVFTLRTPGGLVDSTRDIITRMIKSRTPVAVWVGPSGARAASAGFLLTIAADIAAMAPGTSIGAAHPVSGDGQPQDQTMAKKAASDVAAYARTLASTRGRSVELAELAVTESRAFTDEEARNASPPLVDLVAKDLDDLLAQLDERVVRRFDGSEATLALKGARRETAAMTLRQRLLSTIAHPQIAYLLFSLGTLGLTIELWNPGAILPGVVGGICLILAFLALSVLPVNYAGIALILMAMVFFVAELKVASHGILGAGGVIALILGSMILFQGGGVAGVSLGVILVATAITAAFFLVVVGAGLRAQRRKVTTGAGGLVGLRAVALSRLAPDGSVRLGDEIWRAVATSPVDAGAAVEITAVEGLTLRVRPVAKEA